MLDLAPFPGAHFEWYEHSLQFLLNFTQGLEALHPDCVAANHDAPHKCLFANETLVGFGYTYIFLNTPPSNQPTNQSSMIA
eukprot:COSAG05_NODE_2403_length_3107_cov_1.609375_5_plen_81_part_00